MTPYELKRKHEEKHPGSHFFDQDTLKFFGEALSRMKVLKSPVCLKDVCGNLHTCYVLSATRTKNAFGSCRAYTVHHYFDVDTLEGICL